MNKSYLLLLPITFVLAFGLSSSSAEAVVTNITGSDLNDTYVKHDTPTANFGLDQILVIRGVSAINIPQIWYDVSDLNITTVNNATLYLYESNAQNISISGNPVWAFETTNQTFIDNFDETTVNWNSQGGCWDIGVFSPYLNSNCDLLSKIDSISDDEGRYGWDITSAVQNSADGSGRGLITLNSTSSLSMVFESSDNVAVDRRAYIELEYDSGEIQTFVNVTWDNVVRTGSACSDSGTVINQSQFINSSGYSSTGSAGCGTFHTDNTWDWNLLYFDLTGIGTNITFAELQLYRNGTIQGDDSVSQPHIEVTQLDAVWDPATVTWDNRPNEIGGTTQQFNNPASTWDAIDNQYVGFDITNAVINQSGNGYSNINVRAFNSLKQFSIPFSSSDDLDGFTPRLYLEYFPTAITDDPPIIANVSTNPTSPAMNPLNDFSNLTVDFYATVTDDFQISSVVLETHGVTNTTATAIGDVYLVQTDVICNQTTPLNDYQWFATDNATQTTMSITNSFTLDCMAEEFISFDSFTETPASPQSNSAGDFSNLSVTFDAVVSNNTEILNVFLNLHGQNISATDTYPTYTVIADVVCNATSPINDFQWFIENSISNSSSVFSYSLSCSPITPPSEGLTGNNLLVANLIVVILSIGGIVFVIGVLVNRAMKGKIKTDDIILAIIGTVVILAGVSTISTIIAGG